MCGGYELPGACGGGAAVAAAGSGVDAAAGDEDEDDGLKAASFSRVKSLNTGMRSGLKSNTEAFNSHNSVQLKTM